MFDLTGKETTPNLSAIGWPSRVPADAVHRCVRSCSASSAPGRPAPPRLAVRHRTEIEYYIYRYKKRLFYSIKHYQHYGNFYFYFSKLFW